LVAIRVFQKELRDIAWKKAGVVRTAKGLREGLREILDLERRTASLRASNIQERKWLNDLQSAALVVKAIVTASLEREESRGSFIRKDYPHEDNPQWLKNSCLTYRPEKNEFALRFPEAET
jgi:succinate dehydrogenase/fumarate reductase flavoprotein subunit